MSDVCCAPTDSVNLFFCSLYFQQDSKVYDSTLQLLHASLTLMATWISIIAVH